MLTFLVSAAPAAAHRNLEFTETGARSGDVVHFSITGLDGAVTYELTADDRKIVEGAGIDDVSGAFTMPDLGSSARAVKVEAEIRESGKRKKVKEKLDYLGAALPVPKTPPVSKTPPAPDPAPAPPVVVPPSVASPEPVSTPTAVQGASSVTALTQPSSSAKPHKSSRKPSVERTGHVVRHEAPRHVQSRRERLGTGGASWHHRVRRSHARTAPLFDGVPEAGAGSTTQPTGTSSLNAIAPRTLSAATDTPSGADGSAFFVIVVPALLALLSFALAGTVVVRRRRLASRLAP